MKLLNYLIGTSRGPGARQVRLLNSDDDLQFSDPLFILQSLGTCLHACRAYELIFRTHGGEFSAGEQIKTTVWNCDGEIIPESDVHVKYVFRSTSECV